MALTEKRWSYAYAGPFIGRAAYDWSVEMSIYLRMDEHRHGLGKMLYQKMEDVLRAQGILNLNACIAVPKADGDAYLTDNSMKFHEHMGYQMVGRFHDSGYKFGRWYDIPILKNPCSVICTAGILLWNLFVHTDRIAFMVACSF